VIHLEIKINLKYYVYLKIQIGCYCQNTNPADLKFEKVFEQQSYVIFIHIFCHTFVLVFH